MSVTETSPFNMSPADLKHELIYYRSEQATRPGVTIEDLASVARTYRDCLAQTNESLSYAEVEKRIAERRTQAELCTETGDFRELCDGNLCICKGLLRSLTAARRNMRYFESICQKLEELIDVIEYCIAKVLARR